MTDDRLISSAILRSQPGKAAVTQAWLDGHKQKTIAKAFGLTSASGINLVVRDFIVSMCPEEVSQRHDHRDTPLVYRYGDDRKRLAAKALVRYHLMGVKP